jgi:hypothetical protein
MKIVIQLSDAERILLRGARSVSVDVVAIGLGILATILCFRLGGWGRLWGMLSLMFTLTGVFEAWVKALPYWNLARQVWRQETVTGQPSLFPHGEPNEIR